MTVRQRISEFRKEGKEQKDVRFHRFIIRAYSPTTLSERTSELKSRVRGLWEAEKAERAERKKGHDSEGYFGF